MVMRVFFDIDASSFLFLLETTRTSLFFIAPLSANQHTDRPSLFIVMTICIDLTRAELTFFPDHMFRAIVLDLTIITLINDILTHSFGADEDFKDHFYFWITQGPKTGMPPPLWTLRRVRNRAGPPLL